MKIELIDHKKDESVIFKIRFMDQTTAEVELAIDDYDLTENALKYLATFHVALSHEAKAIAETLKAMMIARDKPLLNVADVGQKQARYTDDNGKDLIDKWEERYSIEEFRLIMWAMIEKYNERLGKKDAPIKEVAKIADYANRWLQAEKRAVK